MKKPDIFVVLTSDSVHNVQMEDLPYLVRSHVEKDNTRFHDWIKEMTTMRVSLLFYVTMAGLSWNLYNFF